VRIREAITDLSLVHGPLHVVLVVGALVALAGLLTRRGRSWWLRRVPMAVAAAAVALGAVWLVITVTAPWPDGLPTQVLAWIGAGLLALALAVTGLRHQRWSRRLLSIAGALLVVLGAADAIDTVYGEFPTVGTALQMAPRNQVPAAEVVGRYSSAAPVSASPGQPLSQSWRPPAALPAHGVVTEVHIPPTRSGFAARDAWVYLPPAYLATPHPLLPVLELIGGQPGNPRDWLDGGRLAQHMDAWASTHGGLAPVVVMPDALGAPVANPMCLNSALGQADTYLAQDVPAWVQSHLQVDPDHHHWAVAGFSFGGTCALQLAVAHPAVFPTFFDASGQRAPTLGDPVRTVAAAFHGDQAAYRAQDPLAELAARPWAGSGSAGYLVVGAQDSDYEPQQRTVAAAASAAGLAVTVTELPGGHAWTVCDAGFDQALPWLTKRMGLLP
jgi:S-formylglutathione hydrolase FrmB